MEGSRPARAIPRQVHFQYHQVKVPSARRGRRVSNIIERQINNASRPVESVEATTFKGTAAP